MKKLLTFLILIVLAIILFKAYDASKENGKSVLENAGKETKVLFDNTKEKVKEGSTEFKKGFDTDTTK